MDYFRGIFEKIVSGIIISPEDSDTDRAKKIILYAFFGSLVMVFVVSWIIFVSFTFTADIVKVPNIQGDNIYRALEKLSEKKLVANVAPKYSETIDEGIVFSQNPSQGSLVKSGRLVSLSVSLGTQKRSLPDFRGLTLLELNDFLVKEYPSKIPFQIDTPSYEFNENVEKDRIIRQEPKDGTSIKNIKKIKLWVSNGPKNEALRTLKNYIGKKVEDVSKELAQLEIPYNYQYNIIQEKENDMIVTAQSIGDGAIIDEILKNNKTLIITVNKYQFINDEKITSTYLLDIPKKALPFKLEIKLKVSDTEEKSIMKMDTKGGMSLPVPYSARSNAKLVIYIDDTLYKEQLISQESTTK